MDAIFNPAHDVHVEITTEGFVLNAGLHIELDLPLVEKIRFGFQLQFNAKPNIIPGEGDKAVAFNPQFNRVFPEKLDFKYGSLPDFALELPAWAFFYNNFIPALIPFTEVSVSRAETHGFYVSKTESEYVLNKAHFTLKLAFD